MEKNKQSGYDNPYPSIIEKNEEIARLRERTKELEEKYENE